jgi:hypothetical protein
MVKKDKRVAQFVIALDQKRRRAAYAATRPVKRSASISRTPSGTMTTSFASESQEVAGQPLLMNLFGLPRRHPRDIGRHALRMPLELQAAGLGCNVSGYVQPHRLAHDQFAGLCRADEPGSEVHGGAEG